MRIVVFIYAIIFALPAAEYQIAVNDSEIKFEIIKFKIGHPVEGRFQDFSGKFESDGKTISNIQAQIAVKSVSTGNQARDQHLLQRDFFDENQHSHIYFVSVTPMKLEREFRIKGRLTIKGISRVVLLDAVLSERDDDSLTIIARTEIDRLDYGVSWNQALEEGDWKEVLGVLGKTVLDNKVRIRLVIKGKR